MKIVNKQVLLDKPPARIIQIEVNAPEIAAKARAGEFVVVMVSENGERVPLTIADTNLIKGTITLIFQEAGYTTGLLGALECGAELYALVGPLGHATEIRKYGKIILVGGGVGIGEIYPVAKAFKKALNHVTTVLGARSKDFLILENELRAHSDEFIVTTDDGSYGRKGFTTD
ncbi:MAG: sulfide/dihydroorotate dehydrogenase-like FAD/NAD-binding protein, partial [Candidatus Omnitrophota bacterium]